MKFSETHTDQLFELLRWRRDVRHFKADPISHSDIEKLSQAMDLAPSVGNSRPWRVVEVESKRLRDSIIDNHHSANQSAAELYSEDELNQYLQLKLAGLKEAPLHLAIFTDPNPAEGAGLGRQTMPETLSYSTVTAIHQLWLVARTLNIGVGWVSILDQRAMNELLEVNADWLFTGYLCIGYPAETSDEPELQRKGWQKNTRQNWQKR